MQTSLLVTKFFVSPSTKTVARPLLVQRLNEGTSGKLTLVCAAAGFGKSTLISQWAQDCIYPSAWLSLDKEDRDPGRFLEYLVASLQAVSDDVGTGLVAALRGTPPASAETVLTLLLNQLSTLSGKLVLVLDDYHLAASTSVNAALSFLIDHMPQQLHLVIASRETPDISLGRLRAQGQLAEIRQEELRFAVDEAQAFLNQHLQYGLTTAQVQAVEARTEGWIAGLKLAAISLQRHSDPGQFIEAFAGSHRFVQDYLMEEVLHQQSPEVQTFLLRTSVLERFCGPLCDAVLQSEGGQSILGRLEQANLFIVPLDSAKRWYRYHHLFAALLRERLCLQEPAEPLNLRASRWFESNGLDVEAFHQAVAAKDIPRAVRLIAGNGMPLYFRGAVVPVLHWLAAQPDSVLNTYPSLWVAFAWVLLISGQPRQIEAKLRCAEAALQCGVPDTGTQELEGQLSVLWAWLAVSQNEADAIHAHATRALELLQPHSLPARTAAHCALGVALLFRGNRAEASQAFSRVVDAGRFSGNRMFTVVASIALAGIQVNEYKLHHAAATYRDAIHMIADPTQLVGNEAHLGLGKILYEWNALDEAAAQARMASQLVARAESESGLGADILRVRVMLAHDPTLAVDPLLVQASEVARAKKSTIRMEEVAELRVLHMLRLGAVDRAADLVKQHAIPIAQARVLLAQGRSLEALQGIDRFRRSMEEKGLVQEVVKAMVVQALILQALGDVEQAVQVLRDTMVHTEPQAAIRLFVDEGAPMRALLLVVQQHSDMAAYATQLLAALGAVKPTHSGSTLSAGASPTHGPREAFSERELKVLRLIQEGHSNQAISERLFVSLSTVKWHNQNIFAKLGVQRRTEAVARALELRLL